jgi:hypothetical protein
MTFEEALEAYLRRHVPETFVNREGRILDQFDVVHEPYGSNEDYDWPASTVIVFRERWAGAITGAPHEEMREVDAPHGDPVEFMRALFDVSAD